MDRRHTECAIEIFGADACSAAVEPSQRLSSDLQRRPPGEDAAHRRKRLGLKPATGFLGLFPSEGSRGSVREAGGTFGPGDLLAESKENVPVACELLASRQFESFRQSVQTERGDVRPDLRMLFVQKLELLGLLVVVLTSAPQVTSPSIAPPPMPPYSSWMKSNCTPRSSPHIDRTTSTGNSSS